VKISIAVVRFLFSGGFLRIKSLPRGVKGRVPRLKSNRLAQKGGGSSFPEAGSHRLRPANKKAGRTVNEFGDDSFYIKGQYWGRSWKKR